jgi:DNA-binding NarL/FixJ family response regulator
MIESPSTRHTPLSRSVLSLDSTAEERVLVLLHEDALLSSLCSSLCRVLHDRISTSIVVPVRTAADALQLLSHRPFRLIITDTGAAGEKRIDFIKTARKDHPGVPLLALVDGGRQELHQVLVLLGCTTILERPVALHIVAEAARKLLGHSQAESDEPEVPALPGSTGLLAPEKLSERRKSLLSEVLVPVAPEEEDPANIEIADEDLYGETGFPTLKPR